ncbi:unknown protein [Seminavis robusta]|uniref:Uncharacterized protein n=1 Tax=Seminavis robusta TaxID=568900 RepID=A0A9N8F2C1_9STRA|nr:unknown protein [Seminavis robusta]|eukprot:Sro2982_g341540.1 n/a (393) ;mRNA; r:2921-4416
MSSSYQLRLRKRSPVPTPSKKKASSAEAASLNKDIVVKPTTSNPKSKRLATVTPPAKKVGLPTKVATAHVKWIRYKAAQAAKDAKAAKKKAAADAKATPRRRNPPRQKLDATQEENEKSRSMVLSIAGCTLLPPMDYGDKSTKTSPDQTFAFLLQRISDRNYAMRSVCVDGGGIVYTKFRCHRRWRPVWFPETSLNDHSDNDKIVDGITLSLADVRGIEDKDFAKFLDACPNLQWLFVEIEYKVPKPNFGRESWNALAKQRSLKVLWIDDAGVLRITSFVQKIVHTLSTQGQLKLCMITPGKSLETRCERTLTESEKARKNAERNAAEEALKEPVLHLLDIYYSPMPIQALDKELCRDIKGAKHDDIHSALTSLQQEGKVQISFEGVYLTDY